MVSDEIPILKTIKINILTSELIPAASTRLYEMGYHSDLIEKQLAHAVGNEVRRAYDRSQHIEQRTAMMQQWADYLDGLREDASNTMFEGIRNFQNIDISN